MTAMRTPRAAPAPLVLVAALAALPAAAEVRPGTFRSDALGRDVSYVVDLPPSYDGSPAAGSTRSSTRSTASSRARASGSGAASRPILAAPARDAARCPSSCVVAVDGGNSFFVERARAAATRTW